MAAPQAPPPLQPAAPEAKGPPPGRKFPCPKCGARLDFDPSSRALQCPYCGAKEAIEPSAKTVQERNWEDYWNKQAGQETQIAGRASEVACTGCGAVILLQDQVATDKCPYCATHLENKPESSHGMIPPGGALPFKVKEQDAVKAFNEWVARRWFAPSAFKQFANLGQLTGSYVPFWTFDSMTYTYYTGERGDDYTVTENYVDTETFTEKDADGQDVTRTREVPKTRSVTHTRWTNVSGEVQQFFDDVLIQASTSVPEPLCAQLPPWDLGALEDFKAEFLSGFLTERYTVGLRDGFEKARGIMDVEIRHLCERDIGGDHQRLQLVQTQHVGVTFKHILLPVWLAAYRYLDKPFRILINGRTGKVSGDRPYSWIKIAMLVLSILAVILALFFVFRGGSKGGRRAELPAAADTRLATLRRSVSEATPTGTFSPPPRMDVAS